MSAKMDVSAAPIEVKNPARFSWPMRIFLCSYLFYMAFSCFFTSVIKVLDWSDEYGIETSPLAFPTEAELAAIRSGEHSEAWRNEAERTRASYASLARFFVPGWSDTPLRGMESASDYLAAPLVWLESRLLFAGEVIGVTQRWTMFAPNVYTEYSVPRYILTYEDGTERVVRAECDPPEDLSQPAYPFWLNHKRLRVCYGFLNYETIRTGYFSYLHHTYPESKSGSALSRIDTYRAIYKFLPIGEDAKTWYAQQSGPPATQINGPEWIYDAHTRKAVS